MFRHPAWAVGSYGSGPPTAGTVGTKSTGGFFTEQMCHPVVTQGKFYFPDARERHIIRRARVQHPEGIEAGIRGLPLRERMSSGIV